jgi:ATP-dependent protease HslVU (ClpYQ) ATPase subunit
MGAVNRQGRQARRNTQPESRASALSRNMLMHKSNWVGRTGLRRESRATQADSLTVLEASKSEEGYVGTGRIHLTLKHCEHKQG